MKHITQGEYELFTTKAEAIHRFRQMQGVCRGHMSDKNPIAFYCSAKGRITLTNPPTREFEHRNVTNLFGEVIERDGKTYVTYYTGYSQTTHTVKVLSIVCLAVLAVLTLLLMIAQANIALSSVPFFLCLMFLGFRIFTLSKEGENSPADSEILINELKNRVEAVNLWDK
jgi:hypothetical protein